MTDNNGNLPPLPVSEAQGADSLSDDFLLEMRSRAERDRAEDKEKEKERARRMEMLALQGNPEDIAQRCLNAATLIIENSGLQVERPEEQQQEHEPYPDRNPPQAAFPFPLGSAMEVQEASVSFSGVVKRGRNIAVAAGHSMQSTLPAVSEMDVDGPSSRKRGWDDVEIKIEEDVADAASPPPHVEEAVRPSISAAAAAAPPPPPPPPPPPAAASNKPFIIPKKDPPKFIPGPVPVPVPAGPSFAVRAGTKPPISPSPSRTGQRPNAAPAPSSSTQKAANFLAGEYLAIKGLQPIHLEDLWISVIERGGYDIVEKKNKWSDVAKEMGVLEKQAPLMKKFYETWLLKPERALLDTILLQGVQPLSPNIFGAASSHKLAMPKLTKGQITEWVPMTDGMLLSRMGEAVVGKNVTMRDPKTGIWSNITIEKYDPHNDHWYWSVGAGKRPVHRNLSGFKDDELRWGDKPDLKDIGERSLLDGLPVIEVNRRIARVNWDGGRAAATGMLLGPESLRGARMLEPLPAKTAPPPVERNARGGVARPLHVFEEK